MWYLQRSKHQNPSGEHEPTLLKFALAQEVYDWILEYEKKGSGESVMKLSEFSQDVRDAAYQQWGHIFQDRVNAGLSFDEARWHGTESVLDLKLKGETWLDVSTTQCRR